jgi:RNA polymerase sigma factor (sigma-70 family)
MATANEFSGEDNAIVELIRNGSPNKVNSALQRLYKKYWPGILNLIRKNAGSEEQAKDIYQEAWIIFYWNVKNKPGFALTCHLGSYIYSICKNKVKQEWQKQGKMAQLQATLSNIDSTSPLYDENEQERVPIEKILTVVDTMKGCSCVLINFYYYKLSMEEVAHKCGLAGEGAAKQKKFKCINRLKEKFNI